MGTTIQDWVPKYIKQTVDFRSGTTPTPERFNELYNLLITQGDFNTLTLHQLLQNLDGFDVEFQDSITQNKQYHDNMLAQFNNTLAQILSDNDTTLNSLSAQLMQSVNLMLQDYMTIGNVQSYFNQEADNIMASVTTTLSNYATLAKLQAELEITSTSIIQSVSTTLQDYSTTTQMQSAIELRAGSITQSVSEQINGVTQNMSQLTQTANMINWIVKSGDSASNFTITDRLASLISPNIDMTGYVTFHSLLDPEDITTINGGALTSTSIFATYGEIAGFEFSDEAVYGGLIFNDPVLGKYIRISPYSSLTGGGGFNTDYGAIDLGLADDGMNTLVHFRSDGYARFGLVAEAGASVRFNDFLRYQQGVPGTTDTILHTPKFKIYRDGRVESDAKLGEAAFNTLLTDLKFYDNGILATYEDASVYTWKITKNVAGYITKLENETIGTTLDIVWETGNIPS